MVSMSMAAETVRESLININIYITGGCRCGIEKTTRIVGGTEVTPVSI